MDIRTEIARLRHLPGLNKDSYNINILGGILDVLDELNKVNGNLANSIHTISQNVPAPQEELKPRPSFTEEEVTDLISRDNKRYSALTDIMFKTTPERQDSHLMQDIYEIARKGLVG